MIMYIYVCIRLYAYIYVDERRGKKQIILKVRFWLDEAQRVFNGQLVQKVLALATFYLGGQWLWLTINFNKKTMTDTKGSFLLMMNHKQ